MKKQLTIPLIVFGTFFLTNISVSLAQVSFKGEPMLARKLAYPDSLTHLPYTNLCFIHNAQLPEYEAWLPDDEIQTSRERSLLLVEMNSFELMDHKYSAGSVQFIVDLPTFGESYSCKMEDHEIKVHLINTYGGLRSTREFPEGHLTFTKIGNTIRLTAAILGLEKFFSDSPFEPLRTSTVPSGGTPTKPKS